MTAIFKKEMKSYFSSMIGYVFIAFFLFVIGLYYVIYNFVYAYANFEYVLDSITFLFLVIVPVLTMRLLAEENKQKTDQLLLTSPVSIGDIVIGKYLAVVAMFSVAMIILLCYPLLLKQFGNINLKVAYNSIFGFFLLGCAYMAIGLYISSLTENQIVSAVLCFVVVLVTNLMTGLADMMPSDGKSCWLMLSATVLVLSIIIYLNIHNIIISGLIAAGGVGVLTVIYFTKQTLFDGLLAKILNCFALMNPFSNFIQGILDSSSIVYYMSIIGISLFMTTQHINKRRWN